MKISKTYRFALYSSLMITLLLGVLMVLFFYNELTIFNALGFIVTCFTTCLFVIQYRSEKYIYTLIKKTYEEVSLLDETNFHQEAVTTDIKTLTSDVKKFARENKLKIETLQIRDEYRKEFMGNIAHELKTPLFTIQSYILTLLDGASEDPNVRDKYLNRASKGVDRLIYIVDDLDLITKIEVGNLSLKISEFDVVELIKEIFDLFEIKAQSNGIQLIFDKLYSKPILVKGDKEKNKTGSYKFNC
jgi:two-component system phosphate regulon sensor histidine kinase PhoR